jgi:hypothetical protein
MASHEVSALLSALESNVDALYSSELFQRNCYGHLGRTRSALRRNDLEAVLSEIISFRQVAHLRTGEVCVRIRAGLGRLEEQLVKENVPMPAAKPKHAAAPEAKPAGSAQAAAGSMTGS